MTPSYELKDPTQVLSPSLLFYKDLIQANLRRMIDIAGSVERLRPHIKTHKTREIVGLAMDMGIRKFKCATIAEAELLADCHVPDVLLAYPLVGPNCERMARLAQTYPECRFAVIADHPAPVQALSAAMARTGTQVSVMLDVDVGQHRTGIVAGPPAIKIYEQFARSPGLAPGGLHIYDGHNHQENVADREAAVRQGIVPVLEMRDTLEKMGVPVPRLVLGGTPTFSVFAKLALPKGECSPGTCVLHDDGYGRRFADLAGFVPAAVLLTRVISRPTPRRVTFDLGYKAVASDPPAGKRLILLNVPEYEAVLQNEEHLVIETPAAERFQPGDVAYAIPTHICPTSAMHRHAYVVENGTVTGQWEIVARDRVLGV
ncbi:MAG: D-TA family PLP-dependent enzyme [Planctomycetes bacterium]|nr:D-TA family PLP-dependent enzyme [Planctomycetota bacterium]